MMDFGRATIGELFKRITELEKMQEDLIDLLVPKLYSREEANRLLNKIIEVVYTV